MVKCRWDLASFHALNYYARRLELAENRKLNRFINVPVSSDSLLINASGDAAVLHEIFEHLINRKISKVDTKF